MKMMFEERRLHTVTILFNMLKPIKELAVFFVIILVSGEFWFFLLFLSIFLVLAFIYGYLSWYRFTYYVTEDALWMEYGIFKRTERSIAKNRIQAIDFTENVLHRFFRLTRVQIETASGGAKAEAALTAVTFDEAEELRKVLNGSSREKGVAGGEETAAARREITFPRLLLAGVTSGSAGVILGFLFAGILELEELIPDQLYELTYQWVLSLHFIVIIVLVLLLLLAVWLVSVFWILLRYGKFTIERKDENLLITRGLLEKKQVTVPIQRIQAIGVEENLIRQPFGFVTVFAEIAGRSASEQLSDSTTLFPLLHRTELEPFLKEFAPDFAWKGENIQWDHPPRRALPYYIVRSSLIAAVAGLIIYFVFPFFIWAAGVLLFLSAVLGWLSFRDAGFSAESSGRLLIRYRLLKRVTVLLYHKRIQAYEKKQNPLERKEKLASMKISIISNRGGKHYQVKNLRDKSVNSVRDDLI